MQHIHNFCNVHTVTAFNLRAQHISKSICRNRCLHNFIEFLHAKHYINRVNLFTESAENMKLGNIAIGFENIKKPHRNGLYFAFSAFV